VAVIILRRFSNSRHFELVSFEGLSLAENMVNSDCDTIAHVQCYSLTFAHKGTLECRPSECEGMHPVSVVRFVIGLIIV